MPPALPSPCGGAVERLRMAVSKQLRRVAQSQPDLEAMWETDPRLQHAPSPRASPKALRGDRGSPRRGGGGPLLSPTARGGVAGDLSVMGDSFAMSAMDATCLLQLPGAALGASGVGGAAALPDPPPATGPISAEKPQPNAPPLTHDDILAAKLICAIVDSDTALLEELIGELGTVWRRREHWRTHGGKAGKLQLLPSIVRAQAGLDLSRRPRVVAELEPHTLLHCAAITTDPAVAETLMSHEQAVRLVGSLDVDVAGPGPCNETALHLAASLGSPIVASVLLAAGANPHATRRGVGPGAAVSPLHDAAICAVRYGVTGRDIASAAERLGRARHTLGKTARSAAGGAVDASAVAELCVMLRCAHGGSDASPRAFLPAEANALLTHLAKLVPPGSVFAPPRRVTTRRRANGTRGQRGPSSQQRSGSRGSTGGSRGDSGKGNALRSRRLYDAGQPSFALCLGRQKQAAGGGAVGGIGIGIGVGAAHPSPLLPAIRAASSHLLAQRSPRDRRRLRLHDAVGFSKSANIALLRGVPFAPCDPAELLSDAGVSAELLPDAALPDVRVSPGLEGSRAGALEASKLQRSQAAQPPGSDVPSGAASVHLGSRSVVLGPPAVTITGAGGGGGGPLTLQPSAKSPRPAAPLRPSAAPTPKSVRIDEPSSSGDVPHFARSPRRDPRGTPEPLRDGRVPRHRTGGVRHGAAWGAAPAKVSCSGRVVGAVAVPESHEKATGLNTRLLYLVQVPTGTGVRCDPPAAEWDAAGVVTPLDWLQQLNAVVATSGREAGDLAIVPACDARKIEGAAGEAVVSHALRAAMGRPPAVSPPPPASKDRAPKALPTSVTPPPRDDAADLRRLLKQRRVQALKEQEAKRKEFTDGVW